MIFHQSRQQKGLLPVQLQCFWNSQNPIPVLDQSVARQVGRDASNILTLSSISLMMTLLDSSNSDCISSFHVNVVPGFKSSRNGSILSAAANAYATWLTSPNHASYVSDVCWCRKVQDRFEEFSGWAYTAWHYFKAGEFNIILREYKFPRVQHYSIVSAQL